MDQAESPKQYHRRKLVVSFCKLGIAVLFLLIMCVAGSHVLMALVNRWTASPWLRVVYYVALFLLASELCVLPLEYYSEFVLEHRYGLSRQGRARWVTQKLKEWIVSLVIGLPVILGLYAVIWRWPSTWWVPAAVGWFVLSVGVGQLWPVLILPIFYPTEPVQDEDLLSRLRRLTQGTGLEIRGVYRLDMGQDTRKPNAALAGLGTTRRVLLTDTLLEELTAEEITAVFAHEVGHHVHRHIPKMLVLGGVMTTVGLWISHWAVDYLAVLSGFAGAGDVGALPVLALVLLTFALSTMPLQNAISRAFERQCDRYALARTEAPEAFASALRKLAQLSLADPDPHPLVVWLLYSHPPIGQRVAAAERAA